MDFVPEAWVKIGADENRHFPALWHLDAEKLDLLQNLTQKSNVM
jgi:hypothetical protein